jgi:cell division septum initiation protein DivIVA
MTHDANLMSELGGEDAFDVRIRGYSRTQVSEFVASSRRQIRDLQERLSRSVDETERLRRELSAARLEVTSKPVHEEISERVSQILKLAGEEAKTRRSRAQQEIAKLREQSQRETDRFQAQAREQTERMLASAQEQAEHAIAAARAKAEQVRNLARIDSERAVSEAAREADTTLASAKAQAQQILGAAARASSVHDGAGSRLNLPASRHAEMMRRLTEIRDVVSNLVASETAGSPLPEETAKPVGLAPAPSGAGPPGNGRTASPQDGPPSPAAAGAEPRRWARISPSQ